MRLRLSQLKRIIREAASAEMDEMAFAGPLRHRQVGEEFYGEDTPEKVERYTKTPVYLERAAGIFAHLPIDVWLAPVTVGDERHDDAYIKDLRLHGNDRVVTLEGDEAMSYLVDTLGYEPDEVADKVKPGSAVLIGLNSRLEKNFTPAAWTVVHSMLDSNQDRDIVGPVVDVVAAALWGSNYTTDYTWDRELAIRYHSLLPYLPFKWTRTDWATDNEGASPVDVIAECIVASGFRPGGFKLKRPVDGTLDPAEVDRVEGIIASQRRAIQQGFARFMDGKVVIVKLTAHNDR